MSVWIEVKESFPHVLRTFLEVFLHMVRLNTNDTLSQSGPRSNGKDKIYYISQIF